MSDGLKVLRDIGAQTIHNETHISREYVQAIIHETFDGLQSVQFMGFVSILERDYKVDLSELKAKAKIHFQDENEKLEKSEQIFVSPTKKTSYTKIYMFLGIVLFLSFMYVSSIAPELGQLNDIKIEKEVKDSGILPMLEEKVLVVEKIGSNETNTSIAGVVEEKIPEVTDANTTLKELATTIMLEESTSEGRSLKILPKRKIWAGYINIETNQKYQKVFREEFALDVTKDWLLLFGTGTVKLEVNGENVKFSSDQNMRFKYINGVFTKITVTEFKSLNKGRKW